MQCVRLLNARVFAAADVDECIMGCVLPAGLGQAPARQAALRGGLADTVSALTINMVCGSGLRAVGMAAQSIAQGDAEIVVAGGMESMSNAPYLLPGARKGLRMGDAEGRRLDGEGRSVVRLRRLAHGYVAPRPSRKSTTSRASSRMPTPSSRTAKRQPPGRAGRFDAEVVPVEVKGRKGSVMVTRDESIREDTSMESLAALKPAFKKDGGTVTAGNAPGVNDAAAALVVMSAEKAAALGLTPLATIKAQATSGVAPKWIMLAPVTGVQKVLAKAGWAMDEVDLFELNEAFAVQALGVTKELGLDLARVNVNGGAVAIGHPIGASGARVLVTLLHEMVRRDAKKGVAALCLGGGNSVALAVER